MTVGFNTTITSVGSGTLTASNSSPAALGMTPHANTLPGDLVVFLAYLGIASGDYFPQDLGDGWVFGDFGKTGSFGMILAFLIAQRSGGSGYAGILSDSRIGTYTSITHTFRIEAPYYFDVAKAGRSQGWFNDTGSNASIFAPEILPPYSQCLDLVARGYNNGGTTTTMGALGTFTEYVDTGQTSPPHGIVLNARFSSSAENNPATSSALAVAKTNRAGLRSCIPIGAARTHRQRLRGRMAL